MKETRHVLWPCLVLILSLAVAACGEQEQTAGENQARQEGEAERESEPPPDPHVEYAAGFNERLPDLIATRAFVPEFEKRVQRRLGEALATAETRREERGSKRPERDLWYEGVLDEFYKSRGYQPVLTKNGHLGPLGTVAWEMMQDAESHALDSADYHVETLQQVVEQSRDLEAQLDEINGLELTPAQLDNLVAWMKAEAVDPASEEADEKVIDALLAAEGNDSLPSLATQFEQYQELEQQMADLALELEVKLADGYLRYTRDLRHQNLNRVSEVEKEKYGKEPEPKHHEEIILARLANEIATFAAIETEEGARKHVTTNVWPQHEQYGKLRQAMKRYRDLVAAGGWEEVTPKALRVGHTGTHVAAVKKRLAAEGYYDGDMDENWNDELFEAVKLYQETHQLEVTGESSKVFWRSLNKSAEDRLQEIEVNVQRWHSAFYYPADHYVYINVPDFHAEVWRDGERQMRFRIVTGNNDRVCDPDTETWVYANATPTQHAVMQYLVLNPYWNVPQRIEQEEYLPEMAEDPLWLEKNGFEYYTDPSGYTVLRQLPGDDNALGRVKFIFPNIHNVYMHDTPKKSLFRYPIRAFSHGCMRVHNPMDFAEYVLRNEGKWESRAVPHFEKETPDHHIMLDDPIDVFIEYFTVRVDEQGRAHFLADPYKKVQYAIKPPTRAQMSCTPEVKQVYTRPGEDPLAGEGLIPDVDSVSPTGTPGGEPSATGAAETAPAEGQDATGTAQPGRIPSVDALGRKVEKKRPALRTIDADDNTAPNDGAADGDNDEGGDGAGSDTQEETVPEADFGP